MKDIIFINNIPTRGGFMITEYCILGDCSQPECHHCFPVKDCSKHHICITEGTCELIEIPKKPQCHIS